MTPPVTDDGSIKGARRRVRPWSGTVHCYPRSSPG